MDDAAELGLTIEPVGGIGTVTVPPNPTATTTHSRAITRYYGGRSSRVVPTAIPLRSNVRRGSSRQIRPRTRRAARTASSRGPLDQTTTNLNL
jgi:hypothetical protein